MIKVFSFSFLILFLLEGCFNCNFKRKTNSSGHQKVAKLNGQGYFEITYHDNDQFNTVESVENDSLNGFSYSFYKNGNVYEKAEFQNGKRIGHSLIYNEDGMLSFYRCFVKPGRIAYRRAYINGKVAKEEGSFIVLEPQKIREVEGDSLLSILITTIIPPDCYDVITDIKVVDENQNIVDSVKLNDQEEFVYDMRLNGADKTLVINCTLHESFMDSVTVVESISPKSSLIKMLKNKGN